MSYRLRFLKAADDTLTDLENADPQNKLKKVRRALGWLEQDPTIDTLRSKKYRGLKGQGPAGADVWQSCVEHNTPGAWRIHWSYDETTQDKVIVVIWIGPHPE